MVEADTSVLAREIMSCLTGHTDPASLFRLTGTTGAADGSVTINLTPVDALDLRTFTVRISQTP